MFLFTSDLHLTHRPRDEYRWEIWKWLRTNASNRGCSAVFLLGDLTDQKDNHPASLVNRIVDEVAELAKTCLVFVLRGNHDYTDPLNPFFRFLAQVPQCLYVSEPTEHVISPAKGDDVRVCLLPHTRAWETDWQGIVNRNNRKPLRASFLESDFVLIHQTMNRAVGSNGYRLEGIPHAVMKQPRGVIISGDVHVPQRCGRVIYCGSPYPVHFGDDYQPRVLFWTGEQLRSIKRLTIRKPVFHVTTPKDLEAEEILQGDQIKLVVTLPRSELCEWEQHRNTLRAMVEKQGATLCGLELREQLKPLGPQPSTSGPKGPSMRETLEDFLTNQRIKMQSPVGRAAVELLSNAVTKPSNPGVSVVPTRPNLQVSADAVRVLPDRRKKRRRTTTRR